MTGADLAFWTLAAIAVITGWRVFRTDSMVRATFFLLTSFVAVGAILLLLAASYLGFALIFMMAVEMTVMALFMVMYMMNPAGLNPMNMIHQPGTAVAAGVGVGAVLAAVALWVPFPHSAAAVPPSDPIAALGHELLGGSMLVFESAGVTLLAAMIGSVVLSSRAGRYGAADEGSLPPGLEPGGEPAGRRPAPADGGHTHMHMGDGTGGHMDMAMDRGGGDGSGDHDHGGHAAPGEGPA